MNRTLKLNLATLCIFAALMTGHAAQAESLAPLGSAGSIAGTTPSNTIVQFSIVLPLREQTALSTLLHSLYTPGDPLFHKFLPPGEFTSEFGPTTSDYSTVSEWVKQQGLTITGQHAGRTLLDVSGTAGAVDKAFHVMLENYAEADDSSRYTILSPPQFPNDIARLVSGVIGLDNPFESNISHSGFIWLPGIGSGQDCGLSPTDIRKAYNLTSAGLTGEGQTLGLVEQDGYLPTDICAYACQYGLPKPNIKNVLLDGAQNTPSSISEPTGDIEFMAALAPKASEIYVYLLPHNLTFFVGAFVRIADDDLARCISSSWLYPSTTLTDKLTENAALMQMAAQGQSMFQVVGDTGAYATASTSPTVFDIGSQPYACIVGGTTLSVTGSGAYLSETTWNAAAYAAAHAVATEGLSPYLLGAGGGGISDFWLKPDYQQGFGESATMRNVPDVSLDANPGYACIFQAPSDSRFIGTSAAAPLWAAFTALVDQQLDETGQPPLGFPNPALYDIARNPQMYNRDFHDAADRSTNLFYSAGPGYDNATGLGSFNGINLIDDLARLPPSLTETASLSGTVVFNDENPNSVTSTVTAISEEGAQYQVEITPPSTSYSLTLPRNVPFTISADAPGYAGGSFDGVTVPAGYTLGLNSGTQAHVFSPGLQLISSPFAQNPATANFSELFGATGIENAPPTTFDALFGGISFPTSPADTFFLGRGYFIDPPAGGLYVHRVGASPDKSPFLVFLDPGWNLIGTPWQTPVPISSITVFSTNCPATPIVLTGNGAGQLILGPVYELESDAAPYYDALSSSDSLNPWQGYWVYASQSVTLRVPYPTI